MQRAGGCTDERILFRRSLLGELRNEYDRLRHQQSFRPSLHIIRANDRADTDIYIRRKLAVLAGVRKT